jgi:hypothetical protein
MRFDAFIGVNFKSMVFWCVSLCTVCGMPEDGSSISYCCAFISIYGYTLNVFKAGSDALR